MQLVFVFAYAKSRVSLDRAHIHFNIVAHLSFLLIVSIIMQFFFRQLRSLPRIAAIDVFGMLREGALNELMDSMPNIDINNFPFSNIARPTTGIRRTSIWGIKVRENLV